MLFRPSCEIDSTGPSDGLAVDGKEVFLMSSRGCRSFSYTIPPR